MLINLNVESEVSVALHRIVHRIPITQARINLGQVVRRVHLDREYFIFEKDGIPVAGLMNVDEMEDYLELQDPGLKKQVRQSFREYRRDKARDANEFLAELRRPRRKAAR